MSLHEDGNRVNKGEHDEVQNDIPRGVIFVKKSGFFENLKFEMGGSGCRGWIRLEELVWTLLGR